MSVHVLCLMFISESEEFAGAIGDSLAAYGETPFLQQ
jgi:hypothetical protein